MDGNILLWIQDHLRWEGMNWFWKGITSLGNGGWFWIVLCILMVVLAKIPGEKYSIKDENCSRAVIGRAGWYGLLSMGAGALITNVCLKNLVARTRPYEVVEGLVPLIGKPTDYSFPSGHALSSTIAATVITLYRRKWGIIVIPIAYRRKQADGCQNRLRHRHHNLKQNRRFIRAVHTRGFQQTFRNVLKKALNQNQIISRKHSLNHQNQQRII